MQLDSDLEASNNLFSAKEFYTGRAVPIQQIYFTEDESWPISTQTIR